MKPIHRFGFFSIFVSMSLPLAGQSTYVAGTGNWSNAANWNPAAVPATGSNIILSDASAAGGTLTLDGSTSRTIGSFTHGTTGTRAGEFTLQTSTNTLTMSGGLIANGNFNAIGLRLRGNFVASTQAWQIGGNPGSATVDSGVLVHDRAASTRGVFTLAGTVTKSGTGQLAFGGATVDGPGDLIINEGSLKLNAGASLDLRATGTGKFILNNASSLFISKNSGTFGDATTFDRAFQFNGTTSVSTGGITNTGGPWIIPSNMEWNGSHNITLANSAGTGTPNLNFQFSGVMSGNGAITKLGASQLHLTGTASNTFNGLLTVSAGELQLAKTSSTAVAGDILVNGGSLRMGQPNQIADTSNVTVTGGQFIGTTGHADTIASLSISSGALSSLSGINVTGATTISNGTHEVNSGMTFSTNSLAISNGAALRFVGNGTSPSAINVRAGGLSLTSGNIAYGNAGGAASLQLNLSGNVTSSGTSQFTPNNYNGARIIDLQGGSRSFAVNDGILDIKTIVQNGTLAKTGSGLLRLSRTGSTANLSIAAGSVQVATQATAANVALSGGSLLIDIGGATPAKLTASGNFASTGGTIEISANNGIIAPGTVELVRYSGSLTGTPTVNIPPQLSGSRMAPILNYGTGTNSAITLSSTAAPLGLVWHGATGGVWDVNTTANFNAGAEKFYQLDSVTFNDTGVNPTVQLNSNVFPTDVLFNHGSTRPTYTLTGTGGISGPGKLTKNGSGTTILATNNVYTGTTDIVEGVLQVGNGGALGSLGSGAAKVDFGATLSFNRSGAVVVDNVISGTGTILKNGSGTVSLIANSPTFLGDVSVVGGTLQFGEGGADGSLGTAPITIGGGASLGIKRSGTPTIANEIGGDGFVTISGGSPILTNTNTYTGGVTVKEEGVLRTPGDWVLGSLPETPTPNAIRLNQGGLKNQDSNTLIDSYRGITITGEAYFNAGWAKTLTVDGAITGTGNVFVNYDTGKIIFSNSSSDWNGVLTLGANKPGFTGNTGGNLEIHTISNGGAPGPLGKANADPANFVFNGGRLIYNGDAGSTDRGFTLQGGATIEVVNSALAISGKATGTGTFTKAGAGTLILSAANDFIGNKNLTGGTLVLKSATALGDSNSILTFTGTTGTLDLATNTSVAPYPVTIGVGNSGTILSGRGTAGAGINHTLGDFSLSTVTLNIAASPDVSGGSPRVTIGSLSLSGGSSGTTTLSPGTADLTVGSASIESGNYAKTLSLGGTSQNNQVAGDIADGLNTFSLRKDNDSLWTVSGNNTFTGNVTVDDGVLSLAHTNALGSPGKTLVIAGEAGGGRLPEVRVSGGISPTVSVLNISGAGVASTGALRNISGNNTLNVTSQVNMATGNGNTTLYSDAGTLTVNSPLITANVSNRTLILAGPGNGVINSSIANGSTANLPVTKTGTGTWTLNGDQTYTGTTRVEGGVLSLAQAALNDTAAVIIATGAALNLNFSGSDRVGSLTINGVVKPDGLYSATTDPGFITGTGSIRVGSETEGYSSWASAYPFSAGTNDGPNQDPDNDGIPNLLEYALGGIPIGVGSGDTSILPKQTLTATNLVLTFRRSDASEAEVTLKVQWSDNMTTWNDFATIGSTSALPAVEVTEDSPAANLDTVVVTIPRSTSPGTKLFARVQAVK